MLWKPTTYRFVTMLQGRHFFSRMTGSCLLLAVLSLLAGASPVLSQVADRIVAVVNGEIITLYELDKRFSSVMKQYEGKELSALEEERLRAMKRQLLDRRVEDMLLLQEAGRYGIKVSDADVENRIKALLQQNKMTEQKFQEELGSKGFTRAEYAGEMRREMIISSLLDHMVRSKVAVSNEEVEAYFKNNSGAYESGRKVTLRLIVLPMDMDADGLRKKIVGKDMSFEEAAKKHSVGPGAETGGDIGTLGWAQLAPEWRRVLEGLEPGGVSKSFDLSGRKALLQMVHDTSDSVGPPPDVAEQIREKLARPKFEEIYASYINRLKSKSIIEIKL